MDARTVDARMLSRIGDAPGFIAALDQSGGSTPRALEAYGIRRDAYPDEATMFALIHEMRVRIMTSPSFGAGKIIGAILFDRTMNSAVNGQPVPALLRELDIVPFLKIDKGLEDQADGTQLMRPIPDLDSVLSKARLAGMAGTKTRSLIHAPSPAGIKAVVAQQFELAGRILDHGLLPIIEPEVHLESERRERCDAMLTQELATQLDMLSEKSQVILKLSLPVRPNLYEDLIDHPRTVRVAALSGGHSREQACAELAKNRDMIASFSRALLQDLRHTMSSAEFDRTLGAAIEQIYRASSEKVASANIV
ncbi:fructose bisphosphate aldolase [Pontixanthobacter gangjinensis]|uniref:fructose-bisphosphate aldolase n=1 Tax=Pontixanthobacter gangjinensis TaxID=1028742 RepID=A0A6I4SS01_9SPHN|nr:fructose bisphosphate aldolase [Pontixanthobacter gangjinensis]MXO57282.1 fructose bisphosphate aldolase [Pontixanthobacter gangjinensis]